MKWLRGQHLAAHHSLDTPAVDCNTELRVFH